MMNAFATICRILSQKKLSVAQNDVFVSCDLLKVCFSSYDGIAIAEQCAIHCVVLNSLYSNPTLHSAVFGIGHAITTWSRAMILV